MISLTKTYTNVPQTKATKFHVAFIVWVALAAFFALGAIAICAWYMKAVWSVDFFWGLVKISCGG